MLDFNEYLRCKEVQRRNAAHAMCCAINAYNQAVKTYNEKPQKSTYKAACDAAYLIDYLLLQTGIATEILTENTDNSEFPHIVNMIFTNDTTHQDEKQPAVKYPGNDKAEKHNPVTIKKPITFHDRIKDAINMGITRTLVYENWYIIADYEIHDCRFADRIDMETIRIYDVKTEEYKSVNIADADIVFFDDFHKAYDEYKKTIPTMPKRVFNTNGYLYRVFRNDIIQCKCVKEDSHNIYVEYTSPERPDLDTKISNKSIGVTLFDNLEDALKAQKK